MEDLQKAIAHKDDIAALLKVAQQTRQKKLAQVQAERQSVAAQLGQYKKAAELTENQLQEATIKALAEGCVVIHTVPGVFVEEADILFEIV
jgi:multidrug resistance efflux pump